jgi:hypothetical protein
LPSRKPRLWWPTLQVSVSFAGRQRLFERVDGIDAARRRADQVKRPVELQVGDRLLYVGDVDLGIGCAVLFCSVMRTVPSKERRSG